MLRTYLVSCTCAAVLLVACVTDARFLDDDLGSRFFKRSWSDQRIAEIKAEIALLGRNGVGHGQVDPYKTLIKRTSSDQRIAELMALIALSRGGGGMIGHGRIDPNYVGRKKRDVSSIPNFRGLNAQRILNKILRQSPEKL
ncbi:uncharacterized protein LOC117336331 [Pecten maximus]|uniref:uncharacterized protein LOC117336331 n=1 Tax=Pecten maximus TaxID=6579 RepID=UPI001458328C|nr:uncharacterized protein LOC117336331 [Pecten maximus]